MNDEAKKTTEAKPSFGLLVAAYVEEHSAEDALVELKQAKKDGEFYFDDAAVIRRDVEGKIHIRETGDMSAGKGAAIGALIGGVIGLLGGPRGVVLIAGVGAAIGAIASHGDAGFNDESLKEIGDALPEGTSALAVTTSKVLIKEVQKQSPEEGTLTFAKDIATEINERLSARQDVLLAMVLTVEGVAASEVVSSPSEVTVFGINVTEEGTAYIGSVTTESGSATVEGVDVPDEGED